MLLHCFAGCTLETVLAAAGIEARELFADVPAQPQIVAMYNYTDEQGALLYQVVRRKPKKFSQRRPDGRGGWIPNLNGTRRVLYRLPPAPLRRLASILRENNTRIMQSILSAMKRDPRVGAIRLSDEERIDHLPTIFKALVTQLESEREELGNETLRFAEHGQLRKKQGYGVRAVTRDFQLMSEVIFDLIHADLMPMGAVGLATDMRRLTEPRLPDAQIPRSLRTAKLRCPSAR